MVSCRRIPNSEGDGAFQGAVSCGAPDRLRICLDALPDDGKRSLHLTWRQEKGDSVKLSAQKLLI